MPALLDPPEPTAPADPSAASEPSGAASFVSALGLGRLAGWLAAVGCGCAFLQAQTTAHCSARTMIGAGLRALLNPARATWRSHSTMLPGLHTFLNMIQR